jgi:5-methylthioribose kinase
MTMMIELSHEITVALRRFGLAESDETPRFHALVGGVASDILRVDLRRGSVCVKRALSKLRVAQDWFAPIERWQYEVAWFQVVAGIAPDAVPEILGVDMEQRFFVMEYLDPAMFQNWKAELMMGHTDRGLAANIGRLLARIHASTAGRDDIAAAFASDNIFHAIRLEPYLEATACLHPDLAPRLTELVQITAQTRRALVHGDVSPKNILIGPHGPVFIDAECAWYGDPAFDLAFCLNHLLLKCLVVPVAAAELLGCFDALSEAYLSGVTWETAQEIQTRTAALLPGLLLARIDGKSPVDYVTKEIDKAHIRKIGRAFLASPPSDLTVIRAAWMREVAHG